MRGVLLTRCACALVGLAVAALAACSDQTAPGVTAPVAHPATPAGTLTGAGAVTVQVPSSMRAAPFDVARTLTVPAGYGIAVYARVGGARFMAAAPNGDLLVSNPGAGTVYRVRPNANGGDPTVTAWASGLNQPHDVVFHAIGTTTYAYVSETDKIARYVWDPNAATGQGRQVLITGLPNVSDTALHGAYAHQLKNIALGPDDKLYVAIASSCNACTEDVVSTPVRGAIYVYDADGTNGRLYARGIRNAEGLAFVPGTNTLWATVNNRDNTAYPFHQDYDGDGQDDYGRVMQAYVNDHPPDEFLHVTDGANFGWPFCNPNPDAGVDDMPFDRDVQFNADGSRLDCSAATRVAKGIPAHSAALGLAFFAGTKAPAALQNGVAVALHGSWNRSPATGYKVVWFPWSGGAPGAQQDLVSGWLSGNSAWGRPVDVAVDSTGKVFISDDQSGTIYRLVPPSAPGLMRSAVAPNVCVTVVREVATQGAPLATWACDSSYSAQRYRLTSAGALTVHDGAMCVDVVNPKAQGSAAVIWGCYPSEATQHWTLTSRGELTNVQGLCLTIAYEDAQRARPLVLWPCNGGPAQQWSVPNDG